MGQQQPFTYTMEYYSAIKKNEIMHLKQHGWTSKCHTEWSKSDREGEILYDIPYMWNLKINNTNELLTKQKETHRFRNLICGCWGQGIVREFRTVMYALLYSKWIPIKDLLYSTWNSTQCYVSAWRRGGFGGEWTCVYVWLSPFTVHMKHHNIVNQLYPNTKV